MIAEPRNWRGALVRHVGRVVFRDGEVVGSGAAASITAEDRRSMHGPPLPCSWQRGAVQAGVGAVGKGVAVRRRVPADHDLTDFARPNSVPTDFDSRLICALVRADGPTNPDSLPLDCV